MSDTDCISLPANKISSLLAFVLYLSRSDKKLEKAVSVIDDALGKIDTTVYTGPAAIPPDLFTTMFIEFETRHPGQGLANRIFHILKSAAYDKNSKTHREYAAFVKKMNTVLTEPTHGATYAPEIPLSTSPPYAVGDYIMCQQSPNPLATDDYLAFYVASYDTKTAEYHVIPLEMDDRRFKLVRHPFRADLSLNHIFKISKHYPSRIYVYGSMDLQFVYIEHLSS